MESPVREFEAIVQRWLPAGPRAWGHFGDLLANYANSGLAPPHLLSEVSDTDEKLWSYLWEAMLYRHFSRQEYQLRNCLVTRSGQRGPDFGIVNGERTIWIEAVVPQPKGIPPDRLRPNNGIEPVIRTFPGEAIILRLTSVLKDKQDQRSERIKKSVIDEGDPYVVAINSSRLSPFPIEDHGVSGAPLPVEAVFPVGPRETVISGEGRVAREFRNSYRGKIEKSEGREILTDNFLNPEYAGISAILFCSRSEMLGGDLHMIAVHNPRATSPLQPGILKAGEEWVAELNSDTLVIRRLL